MSVTCDFSDAYMCGYSHVTNAGVSAWSARSMLSPPIGENLGPTTDDSANDRGKYVTPSF